MFACLYEDCNSRKFAQLQTKSHTQFGIASHDDIPAESLDDHRALEPPDPIPNSVVKRCIADGSVGFPHVRVGHRQAPTPKPPIVKTIGGFTFRRVKLSERRTAPNLSSIGNLGCRGYDAQAY